MPVVPLQLFFLLGGNFDFLDLSSKLLYAAVSVDSVGDVVSEAVAQHASAVGLIDSI